MRCQKEVLAYIDKTNDFWLWTRQISFHGYGICNWQGKAYRVHRLMYEWYRGSIPQGFFVCHSCDNRACVNPEHLWIGTHQDNMNDMWSKNRGNRKPTEGSFKQGDKHVLRKINDKQALTIQKLYATGKYTNKDLGLRYNVNPSQISRIVRGLRTNPGGYSN